MPQHDLSFDARAATDRLFRFLEVEGVTGQEEAIGREVVAALQAAGVPKEAIRFDDAHKRIPLPTQTGNLIVTLPGTVPGKRVLFMTHLDTVPLCAGAKPVRKGKRIVPAGKTALGGDNRTGVACLVNMLGTLVRHGLPHLPLTALFTVREESGLWGARFVDPADLGRPVMGFNVDGRSPRELTVGAVGAERWEVEVEGKASHAGVAPERGVSATVVASLALADLWKHGWFGKVKKGKDQGTSNVGSLGGRDGRSAGEATNVVTDYAHLRGECRSHSLAFVRRLVAEHRDAFCRAGAAVTDDQGRPGKVRFRSRLDYYPFRLKEDSPVVRVAQAGSKRAGWEPSLRTTNGGLDANWLVKHKVPTVTFGAGQHNPHTVEEYVDLTEFEEGCRLALALATQAGDE